MFSLSGRGSYISSEYFPPVDVSHGEWEIGLVDLMTFHSIPNIEKGINDKFYYGENNEITIAEGAYEVEDLESALKSKLIEGVELKLTANNSTLKSELFCSQKIDFTKKNSIASLLGFTERVLSPGQTHISDTTVNIMKVDVIRVECNIVRGSYDNGKKSHVIHEFYPNVGPGYKIVEIPYTIIYLPVNVTSVNNVTVSLKDQNGDLVNLRDERVSVRLHIRQRHGSGI